MNQINTSPARSPLLKTEDWWAVWLGGLVFLLGLGPLVGTDLLGWAVKTNVWLSASKALVPQSENYAFLPGWVSLVLTYLFFLVTTTIGATAMGWNVKKYMTGFTLIFALTYGCWFLGSYAHIAATKNTLAKLNITWSMGLTQEIGFVIAMVVGLIIGNFWLGLASYLQEAARPEWFIKTGIVILGSALGIKALGSMNLASTVIVRGLCAIVEAYLIYWPVVYFISRKWFKLTPEWAAPLASGISICGVSAAIATGGAIRSRPQIPIILSSVIVVFVAVELLLLPWMAEMLLYKEPLVAGAWMGLAVKSDGGAVASGAITDALISAKALATMGIKWEPGWMLTTATVTKVFIDIFIGIWAFILAIIWSVYRIDNRDGKEKGDKVSAAEIWERFPKFVIGYAATFFILLLIGLLAPHAIKAATTGADQANGLRGIFFMLTFFSIGLVTNVRKLWAEGMGKIVVVYAVCLFGFILWVGLFISWIFYHGIMPPVVGG
ncbi:putative sulfate exporter family transporter [Desulfotruncus alcoholivorax]|uniref:putative sulfate exporter family transporter n=1 Tax=Desulfotruncus alcoholivorax TaxID=265477 RepID=UPI000412C712|nr:putative sulfate exporter family transporter [Desulfotruncus alcoholivorax]